MGFLFRLLIQILAIFASRTFAIRLIYPGTLSVIHNLLGKWGCEVSGAV